MAYLQNFNFSPLLDSQFNYLRHTIIVQRYPVRVTDDQIRSFIQQSKWQFAKTMADDPHSYTLKEKTHDLTSFYDFVRHIRAEGQWRLWRFRHLHSYLVFEGYCYWTMGADLPTTKLINGQKLEDVKGLNNPLVQ